MLSKQDKKFVLLILHSLAAADKMKGVLFVVLLSVHLKSSRFRVLKACFLKTDSKSNLFSRH